MDEGAALPIGPTEIARRTGLPQSYVSLILMGKQKPSLRAALLIWHHTAISLGVLQGVSDEAIIELWQANKERLRLV
jgi:transcriptional regulator with XRE-family HTH domain